MCVPTARLASQAGMTSSRCNSTTAGTVVTAQCLLPGQVKSVSDVLYICDFLNHCYPCAGFSEDSFDKNLSIDGVCIEHEAHTTSLRCMHTFLYIYMYNNLELIYFYTCRKTSINI